MLRLIFWFAVMVAAVAGLTWLAEHPGTITIDWLGWHIEDLPVALALGVLAVILLLLWLLVWLVRLIFAAPGATRDWFRLRRRRKGLNAISQGLVALLAGDAASARKAARTAGRLVPDEPVARLLEARAAQELGDDALARRLFEDMLRDENTAAAALHGLYEQALEEGDAARARRLAAEAWKRFPGLPWAGFGLLRFLARDGEWHAVLTLLDDMKNRGLLDKAAHARQKAAALTALALELEEREPDRALDLAQRAHKLDPALVPAAVLAGGMLAARGKLRKAAKILERTWKLAPHPDIAEVYAHLRPGDSPRDRLNRLEKLLRIESGGEEGAVALAQAAIEAGAWETARGALRPWLNENPSARIFTLLAEIEEKGYGDYGRAREWLARAVRARRDPAWTADGMVAPEWLPFSPISGQIGVFEWRTPVKGDERLAMPEPVPAELLEPPAQKALPGENAEEATKARNETLDPENNDQAAPPMIEGAAPPVIEARPEKADAEEGGEDAEKSDEKSAADGKEALSAVSPDEAVAQEEIATVKEEKSASETEGKTGDAAPEAAPAAEEEDPHATAAPETGKAPSEQAVREGNVQTTEARNESKEESAEAPAEPEAAAGQEPAAPPPGRAPLAPRAPRPALRAEKDEATKTVSASADTEKTDITAAEDQQQTASSATPPDAPAGDATESGQDEAKHFTPPLPDDPGPLPPEVEEEDETLPSSRPRKRWRLFG